MMVWFAMGLAQASPFHGCTFHKTRLSASSWPGGLQTGCAAFSVQSLACTKTKVILGVTVQYPGDIVSGRLPAYFIEVTPHRGYSVFTEDPDGLILQAQMALAVEYWKSVLSGVSPLAAAGGAVPFGDQGFVVDEAGDNGGFLYGRTIKVPYGGLAWSFPSIGVASGSVFPTCFDGISEYTPHTWADVPGHGETWMAAVQQPLAEVLCNRWTSGLLLPEILVGTPWDGVRNVCAFPTLPASVAAGVFAPTSEAMEAVTNPRKTCAGRLGPHLPRTGWVHTSSEWDAVNTVAYRMATLSEDHFLSGPGIESGDRWQLVWPPVASVGGHSCFRPGAVRLLETLTNGPVEWPELPATDGEMRPGGSLLAYTEGGSSYLFAVWRRFERCVEPGQGALFAADISVLQPAREALCLGMNAADGLP